MESNEGSVVKSFYARLGFFVLLSLGVSPAMAQITDEGDAAHRQELRYSLQEAREVESIYKDTHLNLNNRNFKKGEAARKQAKVKRNRNFFKKDRRPGGILRKNRNTLIKVRTKP